MSYGYQRRFKRNYGSAPLTGFAKKMYAKGVAKGKRLSGRY